MSIGGVGKLESDCRGEESPILEEVGSRSLEAEKECEQGESWPRGGLVPWSEEGEVGELSSISSISKSVFEVEPRMPSSESVTSSEGVKEELEFWEEEGESDP